MPFGDDVLNRPKFGPLVGGSVAFNASGGAVVKVGPLDPGGYTIHVDADCVVAQGPSSVDTTPVPDGTTHDFVDASSKEIFTVEDGGTITPGTGTRDLTQGRDNYLALIGLSGAGHARISKRDRVK